MCPKYVLPPDENRKGTPLTRRERDVAELLEKDVAYTEIATRLGVSRETLRSHLRNLFRKMGVRSRHAAVGRWLRMTRLPPQGDRQTP